jgi:macrolide-specific efflux system membrane fusion protein
VRRWILLLAVACSPVRGGEEQDLPTMRVRRGTLTESTVALGTIKPRVGAEVKVGSQLSGVVERLNVGVGDVVRKGDLLAALRDDDWRARVETLRAQLASAVAEREFADGELARMERMGEVVPPLQLDSARRNARVKAADVERTRAALSEAEIMLGYTIIRAPVSGTIASVSTYEGETIAASFAAPTFVTILDLDRLEAQAYVDENDIGRVHPGQRVTLRVDAFPGTSLAGVVRAVYPKAQLVNNVVNYVVIIDITGHGGLRIRPEMTVHVAFILEQKENVISVPRSALLRESGRDHLIVRAGEQWVKRPVVTGLQTPQQLEIVSGLREGETIVTDKQAWRDSRANSQ